MEVVMNKIMIKNITVKPEQYQFEGVIEDEYEECLVTGYFHVGFDYGNPIVEITYLETHKKQEVKLSEVDLIELTSEVQSADDGTWGEDFHQNMWDRE